MSSTLRPRRYTARIDNVYFLSRIGLTLRWAAEGVMHDDLPADVKELLARLDEVEAKERACGNSAG